MRLFLAGDVMTGRGIDQILPVPGDPVLHEDWATSALDYLGLAERAAGEIPRPVPFAWPWGDLLAELDRRAPDLRIVNLETAITARGTPEPKGINYRMHPGNTGVLTAAGIDACVLANNHVGDWGTDGLVDTLDALDRAGIAAVGAGRDLVAAGRPARLRGRDGSHALVLALACPSSGTPPGWQAGRDAPGVNLLSGYDDRAIDAVAKQVAHFAKAGDTVIASIHWGPNWGHRIPAEQREFARALIDEAGVHLVHGHSSHHPKAVEVHNGCPILYGCGDLIDDYEGIAGNERYRPELGLGYFLDLDPARGLSRLEMVPFRRRRFRLERAAPADAAWLRDTLDRQCRRLGARVAVSADGTLALAGWPGAMPLVSIAQA
jgi:poly-gamma-glutamate capsule biosynthesis protein CapA/YwtB (metallophosphatase superfamily)